MSKITVAALMLPVPSRVTFTVVVATPLFPGALTIGTSLSGDIAALKTVVSCVSAQTTGVATNRNRTRMQSLLIDFLTEFGVVMFCLGGGGVKSIRSVLG